MQSGLCATRKVQKGIFRTFGVWVCKINRIYAFVRYRYVLKKDGLDYSFHWTFISENSTMYIHYKNHKESVMCVDGSAEVEVGNCLLDGAESINFNKNCFYLLGCGTHG